MSAAAFLAWSLGGSGAAALGWGAFALAKPEAAKGALKAFPRNRWAGGVLAAVACAWAGGIGWGGGGGGRGGGGGGGGGGVGGGGERGAFQFVHGWVPVLAVALFGACVWALEELLAARMLGGLMLLAADPVLDGIRWAGGAWEYVMAGVAYGVIVAGALWLLHPWRFRTWAEKLGATAGRWKCAAWAWAALGAALLAGAGWTAWNLGARSRGFWC